MPTKTLCVLGLEWLLARRPAVFPTASEKVFAVKSAALEISDSWHYELWNFDYSGGLIGR